MSSKSVLRKLQRYESRNVTFIDPDGSWPIVWKRARGMRVTDEEGRHYLDFTAAFGVAAAGHAHPKVMRAGQRQLAELPHAMGDVHPHALKAALAQTLSQVTFERWTKRARGKPSRVTHAKTIFCNAGFEAVEAALKTAARATGKPGVIAFEGGYHGVGYGALNTTHRKRFRDGLREQLRLFGHFTPFPTREDLNCTLQTVRAKIESIARKERIGAILVEPIQARGGIRIPPIGFLSLLRSVCDEHGMLLILDEIYTGFGRTGKWFACEFENGVPDVICLGKALTGGFPLSACVGRADLMDAAWPPSDGEAIHTSTFLGNPVGCAMALAQIAVIREEKLITRSARLGRLLLKELQKVATELTTKKGQVNARGVGLMAGLEFLDAAGKPDTTRALAIVKQLLKDGLIVLPEGERSNVIGFTPPLTLTEQDIHQAMQVMRKRSL